MEAQAQVQVQVAGETYTQVGICLYVRAGEEEEVDWDALHALAHGAYQASLLDGASWTGAELRGKAAKYSGRYAHSRAMLLRRIRAAGYRARTELILCPRARRMRRVLLLGGAQ